MFNNLILILWVSMLFKQMRFGFIIIMSNFKAKK